MKKMTKAKLEARVRELEGQIRTLEAKASGEVDINIFRCQKCHCLGDEFVEESYKGECTGKCQCHF